MAGFWELLSEVASLPGEVLRRLDTIEIQLNRLVGMALTDARRDKVMAKSIKKIADEVSESSDVVESAAKLIENLAQNVRDAIGDDEKLEQLADSLDRNNKRLAEAVAANTPFTPSGQ